MCLPHICDKLRRNNFPNSCWILIESYANISRAHPLQTQMQYVHELHVFTCWIYFCIFLLLLFWWAQFFHSYESFLTGTKDKKKLIIFIHNIWNSNEMKFTLKFYDKFTLYKIQIAPNGQSLQTHQQIGQCLNVCHSLHYYYYFSKRMDIEII